MARTHAENILARYFPPAEVWSDQETTGWGSREAFKAYTVWGRAADKNKYCGPDQRAEAWVMIENSDLGAVIENKAPGIREASI